jgi:hypothetical protein
MERMTQNIKLTASELGLLWSAYLGNSLSKCILTHFSRTCDDVEVKEVVDFALDIAIRMLDRIQKIYTKDEVPLPVGFGEEDVNLAAPPLFSNTFYLHYLKQTGGGGLAIYGISQAVSAREDVHELFSDAIAYSSNLLRKTTEVLLTKGIYIRPPFIPNPKKAEIVHKQSFFNGFFGDQRPINSIEITHLYLNILTNAAGHALMMGFSQAAKTPEIVRFFVKGRDISMNHRNELCRVLEDDHLEAPITWDHLVTDSTISPFSEKLMLFHTGGLIVEGLTNYGAGAANSQRRDLGALYLKLIAEIMPFSQEAGNLMVSNEWLEQPPGAVERDALLNI